MRLQYWIFFQFPLFILIECHHIDTRNWYGISVRLSRCDIAQFTWHQYFFTTPFPEIWTMHCSLHTDFISNKWWSSVMTQLVGRFYWMCDCCFIFNVCFCFYVKTSLHCALSLAAQCIVIGPVCLCVCVCLERTGGRCPNLTTASARAVFASLWAFFSILVLWSSNIIKQIKGEDVSLHFAIAK